MRWRSHSLELTKSSSFHFTPGTSTAFTKNVWTLNCVQGLLQISKFRDSRHGFTRDSPRAQQRIQMSVIRLESRKQFSEKCASHRREAWPAAGRRNQRHFQSDFNSITFVLFFLWEKHGKNSVVEHLHLSSITYWKIDVHEHLQQIYFFLE